MKRTSTILSDFANDFKLQSSRLGVCFDAIINFNLPHKHFNIQSEVHLDAAISKNVDTVYLLNPLIEQYEMPVFYNDNKHQFLYLNRAGLVITGHLPKVGPYSVSILPKSNDCSPETLHELRSKKLN